MRSLLFQLLHVVSKRQLALLWSEDFESPDSRETYLMSICYEGRSFCSVENLLATETLLSSEDFRSTISEPTTDLSETSL